MKNLKKPTMNLKTSREQYFTVAEKKSKRMQIARQDRQDDQSREDLLGGGRGEILSTGIKNT